MKILGILVLVLAFAVVSPVAVVAEEEAATSADPVTGAVRTVSRAAQGTVETAVSPVQALSEGEPKNVVTDPINKGSETVVGATKDTGRTVTGQPVE